VTELRPLSAASQTAQFSSSSADFDQSGLWPSTETQSNVFQTEHARPDERIRRPDAGHSGDRRTNLFGPLALSQGLIAMMRDRGYGRVVNVTSAMGQLAEMGGGAPGYRLAGVGINAMTRIFAQELQGTNVLVNSVDPGWVRTRSPEAGRSIEEGVETTVWLATLPDGGPSGQFFRDKQPIAW
jgi:hypothetical protein